MQQHNPPACVTRPSLPRAPGRWPGRLLALAACALFLGRSSPARATPEYPLVLDDALGVSCPRPLTRCLICHTTARGGQRTAEQPFARALRDQGLNHGADDDLLRSALASLPDDTDSDGDMVTDKDELRDCGNPSGEELGVGPEYGCDGAHLVLDAQADAPLVFVALGVTCLLVRRRRGAGAANGRDPRRR
jgi:hypothetical protein